MKTFISVIIMGMLALACEKPQEESPFHDGIEWQGENETANYLAMQGLRHLINVEREKAYVLFEEAVKVDSSLFACHTALAMLSRGEKRDYHKMMAQKFAEGKNEASKLYVSLLDIANDSTGNDERAEVWAKMHALSNGPFIHLRYASSRNDIAETIQELDKLDSFMSSTGGNTAAIHNLKGYMLKAQGDLAGGTAEIEKYVELYPDGYNPLDSRAEFYLFAGDTLKAIEYYKKTVERFPFAISARYTLNDLDKH